MKHFLYLFFLVWGLTAVCPQRVCASDDNPEYDYDAGVLRFNNKVEYPFIAQPGQGSYTVKLQVTFHFDVFMCNDFEDNVLIVNMATNAQHSAKVDETCYKLPAGTYLFRVNYRNTSSSTRNYTLDMIVTETQDSGTDLPPSGGAEPWADHNYILTKTFTDKTGGVSQEGVEYFDGLGFPVQTTEVGASPSGQDLIVLTEYDSYGQPVREWLPAVLNNGGSYTKTDKVKESAVYMNRDAEPFAVTEYEASPLERAVGTISYGEMWHSRNKGERTEYLVNRKKTDSGTEHDIEVDKDLGTLERSDTLALAFTAPAYSGARTCTARVKVTKPFNLFASGGPVDEDIYVKNLESGKEHTIKIDRDGPLLPSGSYLLKFGYGNTSDANKFIAVNLNFRLETITIAPDLDLGTLEQSNMFDNDLWAPANSGPGVFYVKIKVTFPFDFFPCCFNSDDNIYVKNLDTGEEWNVKNDDLTVPMPAGTYLIRIGYNNTSAVEMCVGTHLYFVAREENRMTRSAPDPSLTEDTRFLWCNRYEGATGGVIGVREEGLYETGELQVTKQTGPDGQLSYTFTDAKGQTILVREVNEGSYHDTYSIYDDRGNLCYVLPPMTGNDTSLENLGKYAYIYCYDAHDRCVRKKLPGAEWIHYVYDRADRPVFSQDGEQRVRNQWAFAIPDNFGRAAISGICKNTFEPGAAVDAVVIALPGDSFEGQYRGYDISGIILDDATVLAVNYYDNYDFKTHLSGLDFVPDSRFDDRYGTDTDATKTKGLLTGEVKAVLGEDTPRCAITALYYDRKGRVVQTVGKNHLGGICRLSMKYDFVDNVLATEEVQQTSEVTVADTKHTALTYDHRGRLLSETTTLNDGAPAVVRSGYDELGRLADNTYGTGGNTLPEMLEYNVQGWLTAKRSGPFDLHLRYADPQMPETRASYTGNISEWEWRHKGADAGDVVNTYSFTYDALGRLMDSKRYLDGQGAPTNSFTERDLRYDRNGNLLCVSRYQGDATTPSDDLAYTTYNGNQLLGLVHNGTSYAYSYDSNGNMTHDGPNNVDLSYNVLNLTEKVSRDESTLAKYSYLSDGTKLTATDSDGNGLVYLGSLVYRRQAGALSLESASFSGGRFIATAAGVEPYYHLTDHLGSVRVVSDVRGNVFERNDYFPYGLRWDDPGSLLSDNRHRYNGKEEQTFAGVPYTDYGARMRDPKYRPNDWNGVDPLTEKTPGVSPFMFCNGNPVRNVDIDGREVWIYFRNDDNEEQKKLFTPMMEYDGSNKFVATAINYLNNIYSYGGATAIDLLIGSTNAFNVTSEMAPVEGTFSFKENRDGGGSLMLGAIMSSGFEKSQGIESMAHELFHGVQHEQGQSGTSVFNEVEAYVFGAGVMNNWMNAPNSDFLGGIHSLAGAGQDNAHGVAYENNFKSLSDNFSKNAFIGAVNNFKNGAFKNSTGLYNNYPLIRPNQTKYLLPQFYLH